jgi:hypothetical protein
MIPTALNRRPAAPKRTGLIAPNLSIGRFKGDTDINAGPRLDLSPAPPKVREAAAIVFTHRPPQQEKLNGGS